MVWHNLKSGFLSISPKVKNHIPQSTDLYSTITKAMYLVLYPEIVNIGSTKKPVHVNQIKMILQNNKTMFSELLAQWHRGHGNKGHG